jgi:hypothetical protein
VVVQQTAHHALADDAAIRRTKALVIALGCTCAPHVAHSARPSRKRLRVTETGVMK